MPLRRLAVVFTLLSAARVFAQSEGELALFQLEKDIEKVSVDVASRTPTQVREAPAAVYAITDAQIRERGYRTLIDALHDLPGFDIVHTYGVYPELLHQRGLPGNNQRTVLYIDGVVGGNLFEQALLGGDLRFPLADVKRIEVLSGPASSLYGANAFNGVLQIVTKDGTDDPGGHLGVTGGVYHSTLRNNWGASATGSARGSIGLKRPLRWALSGYLHRTDGPSFGDVQSLDASNNGYFWSPLYDNSHERTYNLQGRLTWAGLRIHTVNWDYRQGQGTFANGNQQVDTSRNSNVGSSWDFRSNMVAIGYFARLIPTLSLDSEVNFRHTAVLESSHDAYRNNADGAPAYANPADLVYEDRWTRKDYSVEIKERFFWEPRPNVSTMVGVEGIYFNVPNDYQRSNPLGARRQYGSVGAYVQQHYRPLQKLSLTGGYRFDYNTLYGASHTPRLSIIVHPVEEFTIKLLFGTGFRGPTAWEVLSNTAERIPNPNLSPERMLSGEAGLGYRLAKRYYFSVNTYFNQIYGVIVDNAPTTIERAPGRFYDQNQNAGDAQIVGVEAMADLRFTDYVHLYANYTYAWGRYLDLLPALEGVVTVRNSDRVPTIAPHKINAGVTVYPTKTLTLHLRCNYVSERPTVATNPSGTIPSYFMIHANVRWDDAFVKGLYFNILVRNLLDERAFDPGIRTATGGYYPTRHPLAGVNAWVTVGYSF